MAMLDALGDMDMALGQIEPFEFRERRLLVLGAEIGPDRAVLLAARIGFLLHVLLELRLRRLVRLVRAIAVEIVLPAVIPAAQLAIGVLAEEQRRAAMRASLTE